MPRARRPLGPAHTPMQQFGRELRLQREARGLSVSQLAQEIGRDRRTITSAEDGRDCPSERVVHQIEAYLDSKGLLISYYEAVVAERRRERLNRAETQHDMAPDAAELDASEFVSETVPDGSIFGPGERFAKSWTIRNVGTHIWEGRRLVRMGIAAGPGLITTPAALEIPTVQPGGEVTIEVPCIAQFVQGASLAAFKMADSHGRLYFPYSRYTVGLQVQILVVERMPS